MTTSHGAPWTLRRLMSMLIAKPTPRTLPTVMSSRESAARHLFGEACQWSRHKMDWYDNSPLVRGPWLAEVDRRVALAKDSERVVAALNGHTPEEWANLPEIARKDAREHVAWKVRA